MNTNIRLWLHGLVAAFIGGGAGSVSVAFGVNLIDPKDWNLASGLANMLTLMGVLFILNGALSRSRTSENLLSLGKVTRLQRPR